VAYLGVTPTQEFSSVAKQSVTGDGSVSYTLNKGVSDANDLAVFVNDVRQEPGVAYTASGNTITFTANLESTDDCYILHIGRTFSSAESPGIEDKATQKVLTITTDGHLVPTANVTYDLGTSDLRFRDIYLSGSSIELGSHSITSNATHVAIGGLAFSNTISGDGSDLTNLNASELASGTIPDARFPATLPSANGTNLTSLNADELSSGTVPDARFPATLPSANGTNLTSLNATEITTGTIDNARLPSNINVANDLTIAGDLFVNGNTTTIAANELKVEDSLIQLASNNETSDTVDIGFVGHYYDGSTQVHTGFFRDASDEQYYLFKGYEDASFDTDTPPATIDRTANTFSLANLVVNKLGVGTSPAGSDLHIDSNGTNTTLRFQNSTLDDGYIQFTNTGKMRTYTSGIIQTTLDSSGNFGIGTDNPSEKLYVLDDTDSDLRLLIRNNSDGSSSAASLVLNAYGNSWGIGVGSSNNNSNSLTFNVDVLGTPVEKMRLDTTGKLGIGITPSYTLDIKAIASSFNPVRFSGHSGSIDAYLYTDTAYWSIGDTTGYGGNLWGGNKTSNFLHAHTNGSERMRIDSSGRVQIGTTNPYNSYADNLVVEDDSNAGITIATTDNTARTSLYFADSNTGTATYQGIIEYRHASDKMYFWTNATDQNIVIDSSGNVGIGDASPSYALEVYRLVPTSGIISRFASGSSGGWIQLADTNGSWQMGSTSNGLEFYADAPTSQYRLTLASSGNLGIGTRYPRSTLDLGQDSSGSTQISWHSSSTRSLGNIWTSLNGGRLTFGQALKGSTTTNNGYLGAYTGTWAPSAMELSYGVINLFADAAQSLTYGGAFTPTQVAQFHHNTGFTSYKPIRTSFAGNTEHLELNNTGASSWTFYSYNDGHMYINCHPSGGTDATRFTIKSDGSVGIGTTTIGNTLTVNKDTGSTPTVYINNGGGDAGDGVALKVQASGRGIGVKDADVFSVHNSAGEIFTVRNDGYVEAAAGFAVPFKHFPDASFGASVNTTGRIKIALPDTANDYDMVTIELTVYQYNDTAGSKILISGHNWSNNGWYNVSVQVIGKYNKSIKLARSASDNKYYILLGDTTDSWSYAIVHVNEVMTAPFYNTVTDWTQGWSITQVSTDTTTYSAISGDLNTSTSRTLKTNGYVNSSGIIFGSDTAAANALDDYEEGTYTPVYAGASATGSTTYSHQQGVYTKIGRTVTVWIDITITAMSGAVGTPIITLPFVSGNSYGTDVHGNTINDMGGFMSWQIADTFTSTSRPTGWVPNNSGTIHLYRYTTGGAGSLSGWILNTTGRISFKIIYTAAF